MNKTTEEHFKLFQRECEKWIDFFGLKGWSIYYEHDKLEGSYAEISYNTVDRIAILYLANDFGEEPVTELQIKKSAFHEVCELLLGRLSFIAESRFCQEEEITEETHNIIRILENVVFK